MEESAPSVLERLQEFSDVFGGSSSSDDEAAENPVVTAVPPVRVKASQLQDSEDEDPPSPAVTPKGKRKAKPASKKVPKPKKSDFQQVYSDSQRVIRETPLNLPVYQTRTKTLEPFLAKLRSGKKGKSCNPAKIADKENIKVTIPSVPPPRSQSKSRSPTPTMASNSQQKHSVTPERKFEELTPASNNIPSNDTPPLSKREGQEPPNGQKVSPSRQQPKPKSGTVRRKQQTLTSLFGAKAHVPDKEPASQCKEAVSDTSLVIPKFTTPPPQLTPMDKKEGVLTFELPLKPRSELVEFEQRLNRHMKANPAAKVAPKAVKPGSVASTLSKTAAAKRNEAPGARREEWKQILRRRVSLASEARAEEQRALDQAKKAYDNEEEEEEEMTDADTSDEEFEAPAYTAEHSDVCSDLDDEEGGVAWEAGGGGVVEGTAEGGVESSGATDDEEEEEALSRPLLAKPKPGARQLLDSDSEDEADSGEGGREDLLTGREFLNESSMPPLRLESIGESTSSDPFSPDVPPISIPSQPTRPLVVPSADSGLGQSYEQGEGPRTRDVGDEDALAEGWDAPDGEGEDSNTTAGDGDSLEWSFQWGQSLPLAQPFNPSSGSVVRPTVSRRDSDSAQDMWREEEESSQEMPNPTQDQTLSQDGEETQFLDEDGFLCIHKKKVATSPIAAQLIGAVDPSPSQGDSPSELLQLCSGQFPSTPPPDMLPGNRKGNGTQAVRELLGLNTQVEPRMGMSQDTQDTQDDIIGFCSGAFPSSQTQRAAIPASHTSSSRAETSDAMSKDSSSEEEEEGGVATDRGAGEEGVLMRWVQRHQRVLSQQTNTTKPAVGVGNSWSGYESDNEMGMDDDMPFIRRRKVNVIQTKGERLAEFVEEEADLSGEDVGSEVDEEDLLDAEEEEREEQQADAVLVHKELKGLSHTQLRDQVNKAHMKHTLADDKADLRDLKDRFLKEGDLYEDGLALKNGFFRSRRFATQSSEAGSVEMFDSGEEEVEVEGGAGGRDQDLAKRTRDRLEREEFIRKCKENSESVLDLDEDSQTILSIITDTTSQSNLRTPKASHLSSSSHTPFPSGSHRGPSRCNSFLKGTKRTHPSSSLHRSSSLSATPSSVATSRGFIFQKSTPAPSKPSHLAKDTPKVKPKTKGGTVGPAVKKPRFSKSVSAKKNTPSIFSLY